jgi:hypothetical protein
MATPAPKFSRKTYERILEGFRESPGNVSHAAKFAGSDHKTAKRLWEQGWPKFTWARPLREVIEEERQKALAEVSIRLQKEKEMHEAERERTRSLVLENKVAEEQTMLKVRKVVLDLLGNAESMKNPMAALVKVVHGKVAEAVLDPATGQPRPAGLIPIKLEDAMKVIDRHTRMSARVIAVAREVIQLSRTERNEPNMIVEHQVQDMTAEQAAEEIEAQEAAIDIIRREGAGKPEVH